MSHMGGGTYMRVPKSPKGPLPAAPPARYSHAQPTSRRHARRASFRTRSPPEERPVSQDPLWYKDAVFYELHVKAFHDSNGDGIGDFNGLIQKLDYVQE